MLSSAESTRCWKPSTPIWSRWTCSRACSPKSRSALGCSAPSAINEDVPGTSRSRPVWGRRLALARATRPAVSSRGMYGDEGAPLRGRDHERATLERLREQALSGQSATLVIRGEAGVGKSALLRFLALRAAED